MGVNSISGSSSRSILVLYLWRSSLSLAAVQSMSYLRTWGGPNLGLDPAPVPYLSWCGVKSRFSYILYFSSAILIALNDNLELNVWCRLRDFLKYEIDMCSYSLLLVNSIFCCKLHIFLTFLHVCQIYVAEVLIRNFATTTIKVLSPNVYQGWGQFFGSKLHLWLQLQINIYVVPFEVHSISGCSPLYVSP